MGLYNEVSYKCLDCGSEIVEQTNSGSCTLASFNASEVPPEEVEGLRKEVWCGNCGAGFRVVSSMPRHIVLSLIHAQ